MEQMKYTEEFKQLVVLSIKSGKMSKNAARQLHKIGGKMTIDKWLAKNRLPGTLNKKVLALYEAAEMMKKPRLPCDTPPPPTPAEITELESAKLKIAFLEALIDVAEDHYQVDIKKTLGDGHKLPKKPLS